MRTGLRRFYLVLGVVVAGVGVLLLTLLSPVLATGADFSVYNGDWNGASSLGRDLYGSGTFNPLFSVADEEDVVRVVPVPLSSQDVDPSRTSILILGPRTPYSEQERDFLRAFVEGGGLLVVGDDFGTANDVLEAIGSETRFSTEPVLDFAFAKRPDFPVALDLAAHPLTSGVDRALLNHPAALRPGPQARVLANTTEAAWLDLDRDGLRGPNEPGGPFPWLAEEPIGNGTLVTLSDPSVLSNGMRPFADNEQFAANLAAFLADGRQSVLVDESHREQEGFLVFLQVRAATLPLGVQLVLAATLALVPLALTSPMPSRARGWARRQLARLLPVPEAETNARPLAVRVRERHPEWDETTLSEILDAWKVENPR